MKTKSPYSIARNASMNTTAVVAVLALAGCTHRPAPVVQTPPPPPQKPQPQERTDMAIVDAIADSGIRSAIVTQHTLFPYHFAPDSEALNELGQGELAVLISHLRTVGGGQLNVRAGDAPEPLYTARVRYVRDMIRRGGVDPAAVKIADAAPGGEGAPTGQVLRALTADAAGKKFQTSGEAAASSRNGSGGGGSSSGGSSSGTGNGTGGMP
jgi:uncharacterized membrane protein YgcG